jgi:hypothetical protein
VQNKIKYFQIKIKHLKSMFMKKTSFHNRRSALKTNENSNIPKDAEENRI